MSMEMVIAKVLDSARALYGDACQEFLAEALATGGRVRWLELNDRDVPKGLKAEADKASASYEAFLPLLYPPDGYFQDNDNGTSLARTIGLDWRVVLPVYCNDKKQMEGAKLRRFRDLMAGVKQEFPTVPELIALGVTVDGDNTWMDWAKYFKEKLDRLVAFLDTAISLGQPVEVSY